MKKTGISILILLSSVLTLFASVTASEPYPFYLLGHVEEDVQFEMDFSNSILPFDLTGNDVKYNATNQRDNLNKPTEVRGLYVGNFSLSSHFHPLHITYSAYIHRRSCLNRLPLLHPAGLHLWVYGKKLPQLK